VFTGLEREDVHEFIDNDKRASLFNEISGSNLVLGFHCISKGMLAIGLELWNVEMKCLSMNCLSR